jgi:hypothetical protein
MIAYQNILSNFRDRIMYGYRFDIEFIDTTRNYKQR